MLLWVTSSASAMQVVLLREVGGALTKMLHGRGAQTPGFLGHVGSVVSGHT